MPHLLGKTWPMEFISSSQLSTIKHFGCHSGFQDLRINKTSLTAEVVSSCNANEATAWQSTFDFSTTKKSSIAYFVVLYVASNKHTLLPYNFISLCWFSVWWTNSNLLSLPWAIYKVEWEEFIISDYWYWFFT